MQSLACTLALWGHSGSLVGVRRLAPTASSWSVCFLTLQLRRWRLGAAGSRVGPTELMVGDVFHRDTLGRAQSLSLQGDIARDP